MISFQASRLSFHKAVSLTVSMVAERISPESMAFSPNQLYGPSRATVSDVPVAPLTKTWTAPRFYKIKRISPVALGEYDSSSTERALFHFADDLVYIFTA